MDRRLREVVFFLVGVFFVLYGDVESVNLLHGFGELPPHIAYEMFKSDKRLKFKMSRWGGDFTGTCDSLCTDFKSPYKDFHYTYRINTNDIDTTRSANGVIGDWMYSSFELVQPKQISDLDSLVIWEKYEYPNGDVDRSLATQVLFGLAKNVLSTIPNEKFEEKMAKSSNFINKTKYSLNPKPVSLLKSAKIRLFFLMWGKNADDYFSTDPIDDPWNSYVIRNPSSNKVWRKVKYKFPDIHLEHGGAEDDSVYHVTIHNDGGLIAGKFCAEDWYLAAKLFGKAYKNPAIDSVFFDKDAGKLEVFVWNNGTEDLAGTYLYVRGYNNNDEVVFEGEKDVYSIASGDVKKYTIPVDNADRISYFEVMVGDVAEVLGKGRDDDKTVDESWEDSYYRYDILEGIGIVGEEGVSIHLTSFGLEYSGVAGVVRIYDLAGREVEEFNLRGEGVVPLRLSKGVYFIEYGGKVYRGIKY